ncbi:cytochrome c [Halomonas vilamensis]|uniref:Cytochrome c n=1 Tax=Vreelandella vilamensis TaxID=531309 RepID=A0ABU1H1S4_9GAMM|nr:cytochrome c [Halomonas vilamensis]MDR5898267.1 cytochrome c [Halomonas vilamensis]
MSDVSVYKAGGLAPSRSTSLVKLSLVGFVTIAAMTLAITGAYADSRGISAPQDVDQTPFESEREAVMWRQQELKDIESLLRQLRFDLVNNRDAKAASPRLKELKERASAENLLPAYIVGTHGRGSDARPEIWEEWDRFEDGFYDMEQHIDTLIGAANAEEYRAAAKALSDVGNSCKGCHRQYRYD